MAKLLIFVCIQVGVLPGIESGDIIVDELDGEVTMLKDIIELENWLARGLLTGKKIVLSRINKARRNDRKSGLKWLKAKNFREK